MGSPDAFGGTVVAKVDWVEGEDVEADELKFFVLLVVVVVEEYLAEQLAVAELGTS